MVLKICNEVPDNGSDVPKHVASCCVCESAEFDVVPCLYCSCTIFYFT